MILSKKHDFKGHLGGVYSLSSSLNDQTFLSGGSDSFIVEWDKNNPEKSEAIARLKSKCYAFCLIKSHKLLVVGGFNGLIHIIDLEEKQEIKVLQLHDQPVFDIKYIENKQEVVVCSSDGSFSIWKVPGFSLLLHTKVSDKKVRKCAFSKKHNLIFFGCSDRKVKAFSLLDYSLKFDFEVDLDEQFVTSIGIQEERSIVVTGSRGFLNFWDITTGKHQQKIPAHKFAIYDIKFLPTLNLMFTCSMDKTIRVWDSNTFKLLEETSIPNIKHSNSVNILWLDKVNNVLYSGSDDRTIISWDIIR